MCSCVVPMRCRIHSSAAVFHPAAAAAAPYVLVLGRGGAGRLRAGQILSELLIVQLECRRCLVIVQTAEVMLDNAVHGWEGRVLHCR